MRRDATQKGAADDQSGRRWPGWAKRLASAALLFQMGAVVAGALSVPPSSPLERAIADGFAHYYELTDQGHAYRFYAPEPPPTPVVTARLEFADGREESVRLPDRALRPRLRYQRHLALANHLFVDFQTARDAEGGGGPSRWAASYARHLCKTRGCARVTLRAQIHLIPDLGQVRESLSHPGSPPIDLDAEEFYTTPERIGDYACDDF